MANEVKSEIRDVVSAVDVFIAPDNPEKHIYSRTSSVGTCNEDKNTSITVTEEEKHPVGSTSEPIINVISSSLTKEKTDDVDPGTSDKSFKTKIIPSTVASVSSQDSGINLSFHEQDNQSSNTDKTRSYSESLHGHRKSESEIR